MIPLGTPCYFVRVVGERTDLIGRVCTVVSHVGCTPDDGLVCGMHCCFGYCNAVCSVEFSDRAQICIRHWSQLRPIVPPGEAAEVRRECEVVAC